MLGVEVQVEKLLRAIAFAAKAHDGQRRKSGAGGGAPFVTHPLTVALLLSKAGVTDEDVLAAAVLHDTLEDTETTAEALEAEFGQVVTGIVLEVTVPEAFKTRAEKKAWQAEHARGFSYAAKLVKLADQTSNVHDVTSLRPWGPERSLEYAGRCERVVKNLFCPEPTGGPAWLLMRWFEGEVRVVREMFSVPG